MIPSASTAAISAPAARRWRLAACLGLGLLAAPAAAPAVVEVRSLPLLTNDLVYDPAAALLYASVPGAAGPLGNRIAAIDPAAGRIREMAWAGSEPGVLAVSDDGAYLYVSVQGARSIRRLGLPSFAPELDIELQGDPYQAPYGVRQLLVQPGMPRRIVASVYSFSNNAGDSGAVVYDDAVRRVRSYTFGTNLIAFASHDPTLLYAYNNFSSEFGLRRIFINSIGATELTMNGGLVQSYYVTMDHEASLLYFTNGLKVDPEANVVLGSFLPPNTLARSVLAEASTGAVYFLMEDRIDVYDLASFAKTGTILLPANARAGVRLVRWGERKLAFRTSDGRVVFVDGAASDGDGDGIGDGVDVCPSLPDPQQADRDGDGIGDVCDARPDGPDTPPAQCARDLAEAEADLDACVADLPYEDRDRDGEHDSTDLCPNTTYVGIEVDDAGCARWEFCRQQTPSDCELADWRNDQPKKKKPKDCFLVEYRSGPLCEAAR
jgi:DNA-binding beta-propeller fold protein YncE